MLSVYSNKVDNGLDKGDYEAIEPYINLIQWGRKHPVQFIEKIFEVKLLDYQKYLVDSTWSKENAVWLMTRNGGKSFIVGLFIAARSLLFPNQKIQIVSKTARQANETFSQLEKFAKHQVSTVISNNIVYWNELASASNGDGFKHESKNGDSCVVLNGSTVNAVAGTPESIRGKRSTFTIYDEAGSISKAIYEVAEKFMMQSSGFKTGVDYDSDVFPEEIPNLSLYVGTASDTDSVFWAKYKEFFIRMLEGDDSCFVADINCEIPLHPTLDGEAYHPLFSEDRVDLAMKENEINGLREFYNKFDTFDSNSAVVMRSQIMENEYAFPPSLSWGGKKHKYVLTWDPAPKNDNSPILVTEIIKDDNEGKPFSDGKPHGRFVNLENLIKRFSDNTLRPMTTSDQVQRIREMVYEYNGRDNVPAYDNVTLLLDSGPGGQPYPAIQMLIEQWYDGVGVAHPGLYDETDDASRAWKSDYVTRHPHDLTPVSGHLRLISPRKLRSDLFTATRTVVPQGIMQFPIDCPSDGAFVAEVGTYAGKEVHLDKAMEMSLRQMELMKQEMCSMVAIKSATTGSVSYSLPPDKINKMHDDRNYVAIMACWWIQQLRAGMQVESPCLDYAAAYKRVLDKKPIVIKMEGEESDPWASSILRGMSSQRRKSNGPFCGKNPFSKK